MPEFTTAWAPPCTGRSVQAGGKIRNAVTRTDFVVSGFQTAAAQDNQATSLKLERQILPGLNASQNQLPEVT